MKTKAPYGSWPSPISAPMVAGKSSKINDTICYGGKVFWCEAIAEENGRTAIMMYDGAQLQCILPAPLSAKSKVHEYGGAAYTIYREQLIFVLADDQRIYCGNYREDQFYPTPLSPNTGHLRFADLHVDHNFQRVIAVCEQHFEHKVQNTLVALPLDGSEAIQTLHEGFDFYSNPQISADGRILSWLCWNDPDMPWDNSELWIADIGAQGLSNQRKIRGNGNESLFQPRWTHTNELVFVSDQTDWWNLYYFPANELAEQTPKAQCILKMEAEFATPQWVFGMSTYGFLNDQTIFATYTTDGVWRLVEISKSGTWEKSKTRTIASESTHIQSVSCSEDIAVFIGASPHQDLRLHIYEKGKVRNLIEHYEPLIVDQDELSVPKAITFDTSDEHIARALFYPPRNKHYDSEDERPPLIVICHGGPTGATESSLNLKIQFWTSRGFAVADVNYRGSTGYGRRYRQQLFDQWGIYDVDDVCAIVEHLSQEGLVDNARCVIKGSSAGGYTALAALAFRNTFTAGVSLYGIGDLEMLAKETHKFEARYLDKLIGPYPERKDIYKQRSPIHAIDKIACPLLIFQGMQDKVVPPNQAEDLYQHIKEKNIPVALITYEEEAHGFRKSDNIIHCLESELQFYGATFDINVVSSQAEKIQIDNLKN